MRRCGRTPCLCLLLLFLDLAAETAARHKANEELSALIAALSFDVDGSRI